MQPYPGTVLKRESTGDAVKAVQAVLGVQQTGLFGPTTEACVCSFQRGHDLMPDGQVGPITWAALFAATAPSTDLGQRALAEAVTHIGVTEHPLNSNLGPEVNAWNERAGASHGSFWCMSYVYSMVDDACRKLGRDNPLPKTASCSAVYRWARAQSRLVVRPMPGDIFLCIGGDSGHYHTGFVRTLLANERFATIEGNSNTDGSANGYEVAYRPNGRRLESCHYVGL